MDLPQQPCRCPKCNALVVDRRSPVCTTCHVALPAAWVMTPEQVAKVMKLDAECRAHHVEEMRTIDPLSNPNVPALARWLDQDVKGNRLNGL